MLVCGSGIETTGDTMAIRFFATNRHLDKLATNLNRRKRLRMEEGGHYFIDMIRYMAYYLGEVEPDTVPYGAIVKNSGSEVFKDFLCNPRIGKVVVCVHGFNVDLFEAFTWFRVLTDTLRHLPDFGDRFVTDPQDPEQKKLLSDPKLEDGALTAFIGFSWPSHGTVVNYAADQREASGSGNALANLLGRLHLHGKVVHLICHSMGNYLACNMLGGLVNKQFTPSVFDLDSIRDTLPLKTNQAVLKAQKRALGMLGRVELKKDESPKERATYFVDRYVMLAPDVERRHITKCAMEGVETDYVGPYFAGLQHQVRAVYNFYSRFDTALKVSDLEKMPREAALSLGDAASRMTFGLLDFMERNPDQKWEKRLGEAPHPPSAPHNFQSINATEVAGRKIDHSDHIDSPELVRRIAETLEL